MPAFEFLLVCKPLRSPRFGGMRFGSSLQALASLASCYLHHLARIARTQLAHTQLARMTHELQETRRGPEVHESQSSMEDWDADLSPCHFATTHIPAERSSFIFL